MIFINFAYPSLIKLSVNIFTEVFDRSLPFNVINKFKNGTGREKDEAMLKGFLSHFVVIFGIILRSFLAPVWTQFLTQRC